MKSRKKTGTVIFLLANITGGGYVWRIEIKPLEE
jgi:hypothetical protein